MTSALPVLLGSTSALSIMTLMLLFTGNTVAMALTAVFAIVLGVVAVPMLARQQETEETL
ncbi:hypothetical protein [Deinococcus sp. QL22]|uniref:hypothetical protein n=1 Tax=Deinococcus sp. QL22 TaxID=2939437 RepID=UPI0020183D34|nr:hypothetical protein [Deinococcus sp. QL22]UQN07990.1 hypothetical protein M1R55_18000 [Deinococcus sp. QL22]